MEHYSTVTTTDVMKFKGKWMEHGPKNTQPVGDNSDTEKQTWYILT